MTATMTNNGPARTRPSLTDTITKLDAMIDGLSEAIPGTIKDTLQESVGAAVAEGVRAALIDIMSNAEVLALLRGTLVPTATAPEPVAPAQPTLLQGWWTNITRAAVTASQWTWRKLRSAGQAVADHTRKGLNRLAALRQRLQALRQVRKPLLVALGIGGLAAAVAVFAPNWVAATLSGVGGACATVAAQLVLWLRKGFATFSVTSD